MLFTRVCSSKNCSFSEGRPEQRYIAVTHLYISSALPYIATPLVQNAFSKKEEPHHSLESERFSSVDDELPVTSPAHQRFCTFRSQRS